MSIVLIKKYPMRKGELDRLALLEVIKKHIQNHNRQSISFYTFMQLALYHEEYGYYSGSKQKIGKEGDFYTSVSVGDVFGEVLADVFSEMAGSFPGESPFYLLEFGGGTGDLTRQILQSWEKDYPKLMSRVEPIMIEKSPYHRKVQQEKLSDYKVKWFDDYEAFLLQSGVFKGIVFSNELLDAFPVYVVEYRDGYWKEVRVGWDDSASQLYERLEPLDQPEVENFLQREEPYIQKSEGYRIEVNVAAERWLEDTANGLAEGYLVTIDYGYLRENLYIPQRKKGTLQTYYRHTAADNPFSQPGEQDITTHINFSSLMEAGEKHGLQNVGFFTQSQFLINGGILGKLQEHQEVDPFHGVITKRNRAIRQLIMPGGMGETFKVLVQAKGKVHRELDILKSKGWM